MQPLQPAGPLPPLPQPPNRFYYILHTTPRLSHFATPTILGRPAPFTLNSPHVTRPLATLNRLQLHRLQRGGRCTTLVTFLLTSQDVAMRIQSPGIVCVRVTTAAQNHRPCEFQSSWCTRVCRTPNLTLTSSKCPS